MVKPRVEDGTSDIPRVESWVASFFPRFHPSVHPGFHGHPGLCLGFDPGIPLCLTKVFSMIKPRVKRW